MDNKPLTFFYLSVSWTVTFYRLIRKNERICSSSLVRGRKDKAYLENVHHVKNVLTCKKEK